MSARRVFLVLLLLCAAPMGAQAQGKAARIGVLETGAPDSFPARTAAFLAGLKEHGYTEGRNVVLEYRWANGRIGDLPRLAGELVQQNVDVIFAPSTVTALAARKATSKVPVVFAVASDPVGVKLVASLARPGGNATGLTTVNVEVVPKRLEILRDISGAKRIGLLYNPDDPSNVIFASSAEAAARSLGVAVRRLPVVKPQDFAAAFAAGEPALLVAAGAMMDGQRALITGFAAKARVPALYGAREFVEAGGLVSYSASFTDNYRRAAGYVDKILKGANPSSLAVEQASRFDFVINMKTARTLGLKLPPGVRLQASEVIE